MIFIRHPGSIAAFVPVTILSFAAALIATLAILMPSRAPVAERLCRSLLAPAARLAGADAERLGYPPGSDELTE